MSAEEFTAANRAYFDELADKYDVKPWQQRISAQITAEIRKKLDFIGVNWVASTNETAGREVKLLDYACGTGMMSKALAPYITSALGIDLSPQMVSRYNSLLPTNTAHALHGDLLSAPPTGDLPDLSNTFDIAAVGLGFHHFHSPALAVARLAECLKPGGVLLIIDFAERWDEGKHGKGLPGQHTVRKHGFSEGEMRGLFEEQGLGQVGYSVMEEVVELKMDESRPVRAKVFLGRARKA